VINFREICQNALLLIEAGAKAKNINVKVNYDETIPSELYGDEVKLQQIFNNILSNSIKFIEQGEIVLTCKCIEKKDFFVKLYCEVRDTGIGIEKKNLERIFESFTQADSSITKTYGGAGLGLTICRELLRMMDSDIYIESEFKKGTRVYFTIGLEIPSTRVVEKTDYLTSEKRKDINILLVDKNQSKRDFFEEILGIIDWRLYQSRRNRRGAGALS
jgi:signal transduction histidine kinase